MKENPFTISFGRVNKKAIDRQEEMTPIYDDFLAESPRNNIYIITGPRGSGKTVALANILEDFKGRKDWVVARLSESSNMLEQMASLLYEHGLTKLKFLKTEFSFSFHGVSFNVKGDKPATSIQTYLSDLLSYYKKKGIRVLVAIDDVAKSKDMMDFIKAYQGFVIDKHDVCLLMTGLRKNIAALQSSSSLTFLVRAPKLQLKPLSLWAIASSYRSTFEISQEESLVLAKATKGYAMAFQVLGDILFRSNKKALDQAVLEEYDSRLSEWSYDFIWKDLSERDKEILSLVSEGKTTNEQILQSLPVSKQNLTNSKRSLVEEGILEGPSRGEFEFSLPRFDSFIRLRKILEE